MATYIPLPKYEASPLMDLTPLASALDSRQRAAERQRAAVEERHRFEMQSRRADAQLGMRQAQAAREAEMAPLDQQYKQAQIAAARRAAAAPVDDGSKVVEVDGRLVRVTRQGQAQEIYGSSPTDKRRAQAAEIGLEPGSAEEKFYLANGKAPAQMYEQDALRERQQGTVTANISEGLRNAQRISTTKYDEPSFRNAVGPFQGSTPDSLIGKALILPARVLGEVANYAQGGRNTPTEVRSDIQGSTEALAAAIKPLIRGPGEGDWTDADQARLVSIVGDLATARTKEEYLRRLNAVRDRVKANFGLDIQFDANHPADGAGRFRAPSEALTPGAYDWTPDGLQPAK